MRATMLPATSLVLLLLTTASTTTAQELGLELAIDTDKLQLQLGEPVYLTAILRNIGTAPIDVEQALDPQTGVIDISIVGPDGSAAKFLPLFYSESTVPEVRLEPGDPIRKSPGVADHVASVFPIFFGSPSWSFPNSGTYRISAVYLFDSHRHVRIDSNVLSITVTPSDVGQTLVDDSAAGIEAAKFLLWQQGDHLGKGRAHLQRLLDTHPDSLLASYIRLAKGRNLSRSFRDFTRDRIRPPQCGAALSYLEAVDVDLLPSYLQILHAISVSRCSELLGDPEAARIHRSRAETLGAGREEFRRVLAAR